MRRQTIGRDASGEEKADNSLRGKSLQRALGGEPPRTLTPYEWEQWYAEHGVPDSHRKPDQGAVRRWWQFWKEVK